MPFADKYCMLRTFVLLSMTLALLASGVVLYSHVRKEGVREVLHSLNLRQSGSQVAASDLLAAATVLQKSYEADKTYTRADLSRFTDLQVVFASDSAYCIQVEKAGKWYHTVGPGGVPTDGPC
jgi:hypothetical protein